MPYIDQISRGFIEAGGIAHKTGELNYQFTRALQNEDKYPTKDFLRDRLLTIAKEYVDDQPKFSYDIVNNVLGAMRGAGMEYERRMGFTYRVEMALVEAEEAFYYDKAVSYEKQKIIDNGDIYGEGARNE